MWDLVSVGSFALGVVSLVAAMVVLEVRGVGELPVAFSVVGGVLLLFAVVVESVNQ